MLSSITLFFTECAEILLHFTHVAMKSSKNTPHVFAI